MVQPNGIRVRFAPSPTGYLHIGGARTALYNWLFAQARGGSFILRIEDTDRSRSTEDAIAQIIASMRWLGLNWDEGPEVGGERGPYRQTERLDTYRAFVERLENSGSAYPCYCTPEELEREREEARRGSRPPVYGGRCRGLSDEERRSFEAEGRRPAIRFSTPDEGQTVVRDLIRGDIPFENRLQGDFIILRADGIPTYNFAVVVDDLTMGITHVIRGDDHLSNTPRQLLTYQALGERAPEFAHLPMILGPDGKRLSKRHGATSVEEFRSGGYLPEALVNYLALLGWGWDDSTTIFTVPDLIEKFSLERVGKNPSIFDPAKLEWMNGWHLRRLPTEELAGRLADYLTDTGLLAAKPAGAELERLEAAAAISQEKLRLLADFERMADFLVQPFALSAEGRATLESFAHSAVVLALAETRLAQVEPWALGGIEAALRGIVEEKGLKPKEVFQPVRVAISGRTVTPGVFECLHVLGREESLRRIGEARRAPAVTA